MISKSKALRVLECKGEISLQKLNDHGEMGLGP